MSFAAFLQPKGELELIIEKWKKKVEKNFPNQPYTCHPPHLTIISLEVINEIDAIETVINQLENVKPFKIQITSPAVFWNDEQSGGHTLYFKVKRNNGIYSLQQKVANALSSEKKLINPPDYVLKNNDYLKSFNNFGFQFIGQHWIPHFSISSLNKRKNNPLIRDFLSTKLNFSLVIEEVSLWRIQGDSHKKLKNILLT